jgi:hypothetical protein
MEVRFGLDLVLGAYQIITKWECTRTYIQQRTIFGGNR